MNLNSLWIRIRLLWGGWVWVVAGGCWVKLCNIIGTRNTVVLVLRPLSRNGFPDNVRRSVYMHSRSFAPSLLRSFARALARSLVRLFAPLLLRYFARSLARSIASLLVRSFARSFARALLRSFVRSLARSFVRSFANICCNLTSVVSSYPPSYRP